MILQHFEISCQLKLSLHEKKKKKKKKKRMKYPRKKQIKKVNPQISLDILNH